MCACGLAQSKRFTTPVTVTGLVMLYMVVEWCASTGNAVSNRPRTKERRSSRDRIKNLRKTSVRSLYYAAPRRYKPLPGYSENSGLNACRDAPGEALPLSPQMVARVCGILASYLQTSRVKLSGRRGQNELGPNFGAMDADEGLDARAVGQADGCGRGMDRGREGQAGRKATGTIRLG